MAPPNRRSSRRSPSDEPQQAPQDSTRIKSASAVRRNAPRDEEYGAAEDEAYPPDEDTGDQGYDDEGTPTPGVEDDDNPDATRAGPPLTLEILEGPDQGRKKRFRSVRMVIGRGQDCDLMLLDQSVSRRHVELVYGGESGVMLRDLVSGNGTRVNDERVDECKLKHNDVIAIGRTRIRLIDEQEAVRQMRLAAEEAERKEKEEAERQAKEAEEAAKKAAEAGAAGTAGDAGATPEGAEPDAERDKKTQVRDIRDIPRRSPPPRTNLGLLAAAALVLLIALIGGGVLFIKRGPPPPPPPNPKEVLAQDLMQQARAAFRNGDYAQAVKLAEEAEATFPGIPTHGFLQTARAELAIVQAFEQVRQLAGENRFEEARALLSKTPHGTVKTEEMREKLDAELATAEVAWRVKQVEMALDARDVEGARALIRQLPIERQPLYLSKLEELEALIAQEDRDAAAQDRAARAAAARRAKEQREAFIAAAFSPVEQRFNAGDYSRAALECDRVIDAHSDDKEIRDRAKLLKKLLPQFARVYQDAQRKVQANALESAARPLRSAAELYRQIGFKGPVGDTLNGQLAASAVVAGKAALARGDLANANGFFNDALRLSPEDEKAQAGLASVQAKLNDVFRQAYLIKDREPEEATEKFRLVFQLASEGSELKTKAETQLLALEQ
ncbi:MAG TPA: FHA domain-containing protein [Archangium sp.]|uniref:FHA domain-containing protein n=1 Tax=Archangium sp. TaxID=1872627 RepID=UPI002E2ECCD9|nr:FHA domain-containing protein [Archangium sp.]HEX5751369.1 FHA domain-containing protein [Archangium sp.]